MVGILHSSKLVKAVSFTQLMLLAAIFGFFYAYASSAMWGLDLVPGAVAIEAMNGINTAVRNGAFAPAFFGPIPVGIIAVFLLWIAGAKSPAMWYGAALLAYLLGGFLVTMSVSVPMNRELLATQIPSDPQEASEIWRNYSETWQFWNWVRTAFSGLGFGFAAIGFYRLGRAEIKI